MRAVVMADGQPDPADERVAADADLLIAADGGARWLVDRGLTPQVLVGDMDSVDEATIARLAAGGTEVIRHPREKDASDTELALEEAVRRGATQVVLLGALGGGRVDHELANLLLLAGADFAEREITVLRGSTTVRAVRGPGSLDLRGDRGASVTLAPVGGDVLGVTTTGLRYPLRGETLRMGRSRGLSNEIVQPGSSVRVEAGTLLVVELTGDADSASRGVQ